MGGHGRFRQRRQREATAAVDNFDRKVDVTMRKGTRWCERSNGQQATPCVSRQFVPFTLNMKNRHTPTYPPTPTYPSYPPTHPHLPTVYTYLPDLPTDLLYRPTHLPTYLPESASYGTTTYPLLLQAWAGGEVRAGQRIPRAEAMPCIELKDTLQEFSQGWVEGDALVSLRRQNLRQTFTFPYLAFATRAKDRGSGCELRHDGELIFNSRGAGGGDEPRTIKTAPARRGF